VSEGQATASNFSEHYQPMFHFHFATNNEIQTHYNLLQMPSGGLIAYPQGQLAANCHRLTLPPK